MSNGRAERMVGTIKRPIGKMVLNDHTTWDKALPFVLYGYRRRHLDTGFSLLEPLHGVSSGMPLEVKYNELEEDSTEAARMVEIMQSKASRASHVTKKGVYKRQIRASAKFEVRDLVGVVR